MNLLWCLFMQTSTNCFWEYVLAKPLWKSVWISFRKLGIDLPYEWGTPILRYMLKDCYILIQRYLYIRVHCCSIHNICEMEYTWNDEYIMKISKL